MVQVQPILGYMCILAPWTPHLAVHWHLAHLGVEELHALAGIQQLLLCDLPAPLRLLQRGPQLLDLGLEQVGSALHDGQLLLQVLLAPESVIQVQLGVL